MTIHGGGRVLGVFGDPIEHSLSPRIHQRFAEDTGMDTVYVPFHVLPDRLASATEAIRALDLGGVNVTVPHKEAIMAHLDAVTDTAGAIGAVNTVVRNGERLVGDNTDAEGFRADLRSHFPGEPWVDAPAVILGAGGAARAVVHALAQSGCPRIVVANRSPDKAAALVRELAPDTGEACGLTPADLNPHLSGAGLVVNTTSLGLQGEAIPGTDPSILPPGAGVYDLIYNPAETPLLAQARTQGLACANGLGMLVQQAAASYARWTGHQPGTEAVLTELRAHFQD